MVATAIRRLVVVFAFLATICRGVPSLSQNPTRPPSFVPVKAWLRGPDREDFRWRVRIYGPRLTFQQRQLVQVLAVIRAKDFLKGVSTRDLHLVTKVADGRGRWLKGQSYNRFQPKPDFKGGDLFHSTTELLLRPGNYTIAIIAYDALHKTGNLWRGKVLVPPVNGPLPDLDHDFPVVDFLSGTGVDESWKTQMIDAMTPIPPSMLVLGTGVAHLPVANKRPIRIDVIANLSENQCVHGHCYNSAFYKSHEGLVLQAANVLSQLLPEKGCVRFTAVDPARLDLVVDRADSLHLNWDAITGKIGGTELNVVNVRALKDGDKAQWFEAVIERINEDSSACGLNDVAPQHILVVVGSYYQFPPHTAISRLESEVPQTRCYYLRVPSTNSWGSGMGDEVGKILQPLQPITITLSSSNPAKFRQALDFLIKNIAFWTQ